MYGSKPLYGSCRKDIIKCPVKDIALPSCLFNELNTAKIGIYIQTTKLSKNFFLNTMQIYLYFSKNKQKCTKL